MFFEDAELASKLLEITLTSRNKREPSPVPMCGVPARAVQSYIRRLIDKGYKVAICDQLEAPSMTRGLVKRDVVRVITPGMIIENEFLDEKTDNYVLSLTQANDTIGLSYLDISTGTFRVSESKNAAAILDEALRVSPREVLLPKSSGIEDKSEFYRTIRSTLQEASVTLLEDNEFGYKNGRDILINHFNCLSLKGFGCEQLKAGIGAAGALISYVEETQKQKLAHLTGIETYSLENFLIVDDLSCRNLELMKNLSTGSRTGTLVGLMDRTVTAMGGRLLKRWIRYPLLDENDIKSRWDAVGEAKANIQVTRNIRDALKQVYDLERIRGKITMGHANARDLIALKQSISRLPEIWAALLQFESTLFQLDENLASLYSLAELIEESIDEDPPLTIHEGGIIRTGFNRELDELIRMVHDGKSYLARLEAKEKDATGINTLKVRYNKVFGYYIEIPKTHSDSVPAYYIRKQTLVNAERYITDELKSFEIKVLNAQDRRAALEYEIFNKIKEEIIRNNNLIQRVALFLARLDCLLNLSEIADQNDYSRPQINRDGRICIEDGRHPVVEKMITGERFVPNTVEMDDNENQVLIITGPNMAGKSTVLRQVALQVLMAQIGSFIPAKKGSFSITDRIFTRVGALDNLSQGQSTFMVEMEETANILNSATKSSLVIMDEIGRGTSTYDGFSIAWAVAEYLHDLKNKGVKTLFATHYHELTDLAKTKPRVKNYNIAVKEWNDEIIFLRKLVKGGTNRSYGIQVARLAGIPGGVIERAKKILFEIESEGIKKSIPDTDSAHSKQFKPGHVQLNLFQNPGNAVLQKLKTLDISKMTPLEALNCLDMLREKALETDD